MMNLSFPLRSGGEIVIGTGSPETDEWLGKLGVLTGCPTVSPEARGEVSCSVLSEARPANTRLVNVFSRGEYALFFEPEKQDFSVRIRPDFTEAWRKSAQCGSYTAALSVIGGAMREMLRGRPVCLAHGALLHSEKGTLLVCGKSGIGKSTTCRRWREAGGIAPADDMILLEFCEDGVWCHPMPTWSRCAAEGMEGLLYPYDPPFRLDSLLALGRAEKEQTLKKISAPIHFQIIYSACMFFYEIALKRMPEDFQSALIRQIQKRALRLAELYPSQALLAHLDGNLTETLSDYL